MSVEKLAQYQLWCYYERDDKWVLDSFHYSPEKAQERLLSLRDDVDTPCMPDWKIIEVKVIA